MDFDSPLFDRIRIRPKAERVDTKAETRCDHPGCVQGGLYRAPKGRGQEGKFFLFCLEHVQAYNKTYNYFDGLPDDAVRTFQKDAATGHRPTWTMGVNRAAGKPDARKSAPEADDAFGFFHDAGYRKPQQQPEPERRRLKILERKALIELDLEESATGEEIKARYKLLVKRLHPDANGGDRSSEDKLRSIIQAYNTLRSAGLA